MLDPQLGYLSDYNRAYLRTKLGLPNPSAPATPTAPPPGATAETVSPP